MAGDHGLFEAPAGAKHHGAYPGGLVDHSLNVYDQLLIDLDARAYSMETRAVCALLHDVCKADAYHLEGRRRKNPDTGRVGGLPGLCVPGPRYPWGTGRRASS